MKELFDIVSEKCSEKVTKSYSTSFSIATKMLASSIQQDIYNIYGFVRLSDEIVDSLHNYDKELLFNRFEKDLNNSIKEKISLNPILNSFQDVYYKYNFDPYLIDKFFESMEMDLNPGMYTTKLYNQYIHGSAEVVGLMCLKVFTKGDTDLYSKLKYSAMKLGSAFQKVNFLRDMEYDNIELGRMYFPDINMNSISNSQKDEIISDIENDFNIALIGLKKLDKSSFLGTYVAYMYYRELLNKIKKINLSRLKCERIRISNLRKIGLILNSAIKVNLRLI